MPLTSLRIPHRCKPYSLFIKSATVPAYSEFARHQTASCVLTMKARGTLMLSWGIQDEKGRTA